MKLHKYSKNRIVKLKSYIRKIQAVKKHNGELSERISVLEDDLKIKERSVNRKDEETQQLTEQNKTSSELYRKAYEVGKYIDDKVCLDFEEILDE